MEKPLNAWNFEIFWISCWKIVLKLQATTNRKEKYIFYEGYCMEFLWISSVLCRRYTAKTSKAFRLCLKINFSLFSVKIMLVLQESKNWESQSRPFSSQNRGKIDLNYLSIIIKHVFKFITKVWSVPLNQLVNLHKRRSGASSPRYSSFRMKFCWKYSTKWIKKLYCVQLLFVNLGIESLRSLRQRCNICRYWSVGRTSSLMIPRPS